MREFILATPPSVCRDAHDVWRLFDDPSDLAAGNVMDKRYQCGGAWHGGTLSQARAWAREGKPELVAASDALLAALEAQAESIITPASVLVHDVCGGVPDVPAYLAGHPLGMVRRKRVHTERAPVCVIVDTTISAGISHKTISARGAALLAFVRLLATRRAVELWAGTGTDSSYNGISRGAAYTFTRIDTAPLDLTRAAYMLCDTAATRLLGYGNAAGFDSGEWPYRGDTLNVEQFVAVARGAFPHLTEFVAVPGLHIRDPLVTNPVQWIIGQLERFGDAPETED